MSPGFESQRHHSVICPLTDHHNGFRFGLHQEKVGPVLPFYRKRGFEPDANPSFPQGRPCSQCCQFIRPHHSLFSASLHSFHHLVLIAGPPSLWKETAIATSLKKRHLSGPFPAHLMSCCLHSSHTDVFKLLEDALPSISKSSYVRFLLSKMLFSFSFHIPFPSFRFLFHLYLCDGSAFDVLLFGKLFGFSETCPGGGVYHTRHTSGSGPGNTICTPFPLLE